MRYIRVSMYKAEYHDKHTIVALLTRANKANKGANLIIKQDGNSVIRLEKLMTHIFEVCYHFGDVFLSDDKKACGLILYPKKRKGSIKSIKLDIKLIFECIDIRNLKAIYLSEKRRKEIRPKRLISYLWIIGVDPECQKEGRGSLLMHELTTYSFSQKRPLYFEAMMPQNVAWYQKLGFTLYHEEYLRGKVSFFRKELPVSNK